MDGSNQGKNVIGMKPNVSKLQFILNRQKLMNGWKGALL
jgi:hypothetical protein